MSNKEDTEALEKMLRREAKTRLDNIEARLAALEAQKPQGTFTGNFPTGFGTREGYYTVPAPEYRSPEWQAEYQHRLERKRRSDSWW